MMMMMMMMMKEYAIEGREKEMQSKKICHLTHARGLGSNENERKMPTFSICPVAFLSLKIFLCN
jgi:hypothetical protein